MHEGLVKKAFVEGFKKEFEKIALGWLGVTALQVGIPAVMGLMGRVGKRPPTLGAGKISMTPGRMR